MAKTDRSQLDWLQDARIGALNFASGAASSATITSAITTVLSTAGDGGVSVPLQVFGATQPGVITTGGDNIAIIVSNATKRPIADASGNEVYGKITEAAGVYTLSYFSLIGGVETAYTFSSTINIDFYFAYRFDAARLPKNALIAIGSRVIQQDPSSSGGAVNRHEKLTITALNTLSALAQAPSSPTNILLFINGKVENPFGGGSAVFSVSGTAITWSAANAGYNLQTTFDAIAFYW
jgi:hypothetical protein